MSQFEYVMVLISIIVGLGITHILLGISGIIDRLSDKANPLEVSLAHAAWVVFCFAWLVMFWWWEFRFSTRVADWTMGLYLFLICYAITLFLLQAVLVPRSWSGVTSLKAYFLERRTWFYGLLLFVTLLDFVDSYLKGGIEYIEEIGAFSLALSAVTVVVAIVGIKSTNMRVHNVMASACMIWQVLVGFDFLETLAS